ncbi:MAG: sulfur carrier protein ThiS [Arenicella sp.]
MQIRLNGEPFEAQDGVTISHLLTSVDVGAKRYAIEVNEMIVPRSRHDSHVLSEGDKVEVVVAIGGG